MYNQALVKFGNFRLDVNRWIKADAYTVLKSSQDLDSYRDEDGVLHINRLDHSIYKVEFEIAAGKTDTEIEALMTAIKNNYTDAKKKIGRCTIYSPEDCGYVEVEVYIPDITFSIYGTYNGHLTYNSIRIALIGV